MSNQPYLPTQNVPFSQEAEEAVIGSVLVNPGMFPTVASFLKPEDFFLLRNNYIWEALLRLMERDEQIDYLTLIEELRAMNRLDGVGGEVYIIGLFRNTPTSVHAEAYGRLVERAAMRRRLIATADEIRGLALNENLAIEEVVTNAESRLFSVTERQLKREMLPIREAIRQYYDRVEYLLQNQDEAIGVPSGFKDLDALLGGLQKSDFIVFAGRPGMGKCVAEGTLVSTEYGMLPIEVLKPEAVEGIPDNEGGVYYPLGLEIQTPTGMRKTAYFYDSGVKPTLRIKTRAGYSLTGTYAHPVLVLSKTGEKIWKTLDELESGDFVAVQRHEPVWGKQTELPHFEFDFSNASYILRPKLPHKLTNELAYILGVLAGDGNLTRANYVSFSSSDSQIVELLYSWSSSIGLHPIPRQNYDHQMGSKVLNTWLKHIGLSGYAYEKEIPYTVLQAPRECVRAFLQGLFDTDGHAELQYGYIQYVTTSEKLARQVHILLLQFGIVSKLTFKPNRYRGAWLIRITGDAARRFYDDIGFRLERKQSRRELLPETSNSNIDLVPYLPSIHSKFAKKSDFSRYSRGDRRPSYNRLREIAVFAPEVTPLLEPEFYWDEVTHLEQGGMQHCYDLTVPDGHAFIANGIVNHNTSFLLSVGMNAARAGARVVIFTMEMGAEQVVQRIISMETGINMQKLRLGQMDAREWERFVEAIGRLGEMSIFIDDTPALNPIQLRTKCRRLQHEHGVDLMILDYLQLMNSGNSYESNRVQEISYISRSLKELAKELNVPVLSAAQLSRAVEQRGDKRPLMSDLRESGSIEQDSDIVMFLYRDIVYNEATEFPNQADIIVAKHRNGPTGTISLYFEKSITKFMDAAVRNIDLSEL